MSSSSKSIFDSSTTSTTNDNDPSTLDTDENVADLRLLSKRMAINIERLDDEINQIVNRHKKFKLKKLKMKRYKYKNKRPQTSVASVPTLALSKSTVISDKKESQKQQQQQNINVIIDFQNFHYIVACCCECAGIRHHARRNSRGDPQCPT